MRTSLLLLLCFFYFQSFSARFYKQAHADSLKTSLINQQGKERIHTLIHLADCYYWMQLDSSQDYASLAIKEAKQLNYEWGKHKGKYQQLKVDFHRENLEGVLKSIKDEYSWFKLNAYSSDAVECSLLENNILQHSRPTNEAKEHAFKLLQEAKSTKQSSLIGSAWFLYHVAQARQYNGGLFHKSLDSAFVYFTKAQDSMEVIRVQHRKHQYNLGSNEMMSFLHSKLALSREWNASNLESKLLNSLTVSYGGLGKKDSTYFFCRKNLEKAKHYGSRYLEAQAYWNIGYCNYNYFETFDEAIKWQLKSKEIDDLRGNKMGSYFGSYLLGGIYEAKKDYESTLLYYLEANYIAKELKHNYFIHATMLSLARIYIVTKNVQRAEKMLLDAITFAEENVTGRVKLRFLIAANERLAYLLIEQQRPNEALYLLEKVVKNNLSQDVLGISILQMKISLDLEQIQKAEEAYHRTKLLFDNLKKPYFPDFNYQIARLYYAKQQYLPATTALKSFIKESEQERFSEDRRDAYQLLYKAYEQLGNTKLALQNHITYKSISDSIQKANSIENVALIQSRHENAEKEAELLKAEQEKEIQDLTIAQQKSRIGQQEQNFLLALLAFLLALSVGFLFFNRYRLRKKRKELDLQAAQLQLEREQEKTAQQLEIAELRSEFFTNTSHEFRTPLTLILGPLEKLLKNKELEHRPDLERIQRNVKQLLSLVDETLDVSKIEGGYLPLCITKLSIGEYVAKIAHGFSSHAETKAIDLEIEDLSKSCLVDADEQQLNKVFTNLIGNAFKYTPKGGQVKVVIEAPQLDLDIIGIKVIDNGNGIAAKDLPLIFKRFYQVNGKSKGNGIGLALSKQLVELHGGEISVDSQVGEGSTFSIQLPLKQDEVIQAEPIQPQGLVSAFSTNGHQKLQDKTILIIEDNKDVRSYLNELLCENYKTLLAADGQEGLMLAEEHNPDLVISDVMMPKKDGLEVTKALKQNFSTSHIPIILLTAKAALEHKMEGLETGADDYLKKPFYAEELLQRCKNLMQQRAQLRDLFTSNYFVSPYELTQNKVDQDFLKKAEAVVESQLENMDFTVEQFCYELASNRTKVHRKLKVLTGKNASGFIKSIRLRKAARLIKEENLNMNEIAEITGFGSRDTFNRAFKEQFKLTPTEFRKTEKPIPLE